MIEQAASQHTISPNISNHVIEVVHYLGLPRRCFWSNYFLFNALVAAATACCVQPWVDYFPAACDVKHKCTVYRLVQRKDPAKGLGIKEVQTSSYK